jgi:hypothetical protein
MSTGLLDKKSCQPSFGVNPQHKPFGMVDLQNGVAFVAAHLGEKKPKFSQTKVCGYIIISQRSGSSMA